MSNYIPPEFVVLNDKPTKLQFSILQTTGCAVEIEDVTPVYNGTTSFGFLPKEDVSSHIHHIYKKSQGYFFNLLYWNKYDPATNTCISNLLTTSPLFEDGSDTLTKKTTSFSRDAFYTMYRLFILKKSFFETVKALYLGCNVVVYDESLDTLQIGTWTSSTTLTYTNVTNITDIVNFFEGDVYTTGCAIKQDFVSICYLQRCYEGLSLKITQSLLHPCLSGTSIPGRSLMGLKSTDCGDLYKNPDLFKRDFLLMLITTIKGLIGDCEYVQAEKILEEVIGTDLNSACAQFAYLCGDTQFTNQIYSGCGCTGS